MRRRLLLITRNFPPLWGGMERLNWHLAEETAKTFTVRLIAPQGAKAHAPDGVQVREVSLKPLGRFLLEAALAAVAEARTFRPQVVMAGSGLTAPLALLAARACSARTAAYVHGLDVAVPHPLYRALWLPALRRIDRVIANSTATAELARNVGVRDERLGIVHPGVEIPVPDPTARARFRQRWNLPPDAPVLLSVGRFTARKGLREFVQEVLPAVVKARPEVVLVIVGNAPKQALYGEAQSPKTILTAAKAAGVAEHVRLLGKIDEQALHDAYFGADLHVFPVRAIPSDPEGFGMVAVEAAAHGLATVAYATGGVVDAVADGVSGWLITPGDYNEMIRVIITSLTALRDSSRVMSTRCRNYAHKFSWHFFSACLLQELSLSNETEPSEQNETQK